MVGTLKNASCLINEWSKSERYKMFHSRKVVKLIKINTSMENHASLYRKITSMKIVQQKSFAIQQKENSIMQSYVLYTSFTMTIFG